MSNYTIQVEGKGVSEADAVTAYEALVTALRTATDAPEDGGQEPLGALTHNTDFEEQATDVA